jgi:hypothetical protein
MVTPSGRASEKACSACCMPSVYGLVPLSYPWKYSEWAPSAVSVGQNATACSAISVARQCSTARIVRQASGSLSTWSFHDVSLYGCRRARIAPPMREPFPLDDGVVFLNHGSFGTCPTDVLAAGV